MRYYEETGSYQNDPFESILDTGFRYDVPYRIDRKKYEDLLRSYDTNARIVDADVVMFRAEYYENDEGERNYAFFAWPGNSPEGSHDFYDCILLTDDKYVSTKAEFEKFAHGMTGCIIEPDKDCINRDIDKMRNTIRTIKKHIATLQKILIAK